MIYWVYSCDYSLLEAPWSKLLALLDFIHISYVDISTQRRRSSLRHLQAGFVDQIEPNVKKHDSKFKNTEQLSESHLKYCINDEVLDKDVGVAKNKKVRKEALVRQNYLNEAPFDVTISFEVEKELFIEPMLRNRLSKAQKNNISDSCKKPVLTENGFDNHTANLHTKNSPGWADQEYETTEIFEKRIKSTDA